MNAFLLALALLGNNAPDDLPAVCAERVERNHFYDYEGRKAFTQWIAWKWDGRRYVADAWRIERGDNPKFGDVAVFPWFRLRAKDWVETHTQYDPELYDREFWPKEMRRGFPGDY